MQHNRILTHSEECKRVKRIWYTFCLLLRRRFPLSLCALLDSAFDQYRRSTETRSSHVFGNAYTIAGKISLMINGNSWRKGKKIMCSPLNAYTSNKSRKINDYTKDVINDRFFFSVFLLSGEPGERIKSFLVKRM